VTEPLDTKEAVQAYLDRVLRPGIKWSMHRFPYGWALRSIPVTPEEIEEAREPGKSTLVLEESTGRISAHGPLPPRVVIDRYLTAIAEGREPRGAQIYPEPPPPDPTRNAERLAPTKHDGSAKVYYYLNYFQGIERPPSGVTVLVSGARGHRSMNLSLPEREWTAEPVNFLAQDRYLSILRPVARAEAAAFLQERMAAALPSETEFLQLYERRETA